MPRALTPDLALRFPDRQRPNGIWLDYPRNYQAPYCSACTKFHAHDHLNGNDRYRAHPDQNGSLRIEERHGKSSTRRFVTASIRQRLRTSDRIRIANAISYFPAGAHPWPLPIIQHAFLWFRSFSCVGHRARFYRAKPYAARAYTERNEYKAHLRRGGRKESWSLETSFYRYYKDAPVHSREPAFQSRGFSRATSGRPIYFWPSLFLDYVRATVCHSCDNMRGSGVPRHAASARSQVRPSLFCRFGRYMWPFLAHSIGWNMEFKQCR